MQRQLPRPAAIAVTCATANKSQRKLPAVKRSLAGLPVHRAPGALPWQPRRRHDARLLSNDCRCAGGLLVVPVLQPETDNIPFGLALSWQRQSAACGPVSNSHAVLEDDLYELQYVLDGQGEVNILQEYLAPELQWLCH